MKLYDLEGLRKAWEAGERSEFLFFWGHKPEPDGSVGPSCLSQWWMARFRADGAEYSCAEQYMMAQKARLFGDGEMLARIMAEEHPKQMKAYGRAVRGFDKDIWDARCRALVRDGNLAKFSQNPELLAFLLSTGDRVLVEASPRDRVWGIGMGKQNPDAQDPRKWRGKNLLGFALTEARDILRGGGKHG